jgi:large subunit ribosomal protein L6
MSKIGKKIIQTPSGVTITKDGRQMKFVGPKGNLELDTKGNVDVEINGAEVLVKAKASKGIKASQYHGLYRTLISNKIKGVSEGFTKKLEFNGIGYKAAVQGADLVLNVGYSHPVTIKKVEGIDFAVNDNIISISGIDNVLIGDVAAKIRDVRPPEPYKGKGIKYVGEVILRKQSKSSA